MEVYKFETRIEKQGIIQLPKLNKYEGYEVEVVVVLKPKKKTAQNKQSIDVFFKKWEGAFSSVRTEDARYNAIMKKHQ